MNLPRSVPALAALLLMWSSSAMAAKNAFVIAGDGGNGNTAVLHLEPSLNSQSVSTLQVGDPIVISNYPTNGFYKARSSSGQVGWIAETSIGSTPPSATTTPATTQATTPAEASPPAVPAAPSTEGVPPAPGDTTEPVAPTTSNPLSTMSSPSTPASQAAPAPATTPLPKNESIPYEDVQSTENGASEPAPAPSGPRVPYEIKAFGGVQSLQNVIGFPQIGVNLSSTMPYFGVQLGIPVTGRIYALLRVEYLSSSSSQADYDFSLSSLPIMAGLSYSFLDESGPQNLNIRLRGSILLGVAMATTLDVTADSQPAPNVTELSTQAFTEMVKLDFEVPLLPWLAVFAEGGYRFLDSSSIGPTNIVNGSSLFQQGGSTVPISLDLSGFFGGAGLSFYL